MGDARQQPRIDTGSIETRTGDQPPMTDLLPTPLSGQPAHQQDIDMDGRERDLPVRPVHEHSPRTSQDVESRPKGMLSVNCYG
ncbi:hypothetical protein BJ742DRAFT_781737 [Cladochytrium replicatum]|nr:hypothetical protein BJ742DRAFT_781737 [Cladochytrium replicatum]